MKNLKSKIAINILLTKNGCKLLFTTTFKTNFVSYTELNK